MKIVNEFYIKKGNEKENNEYKIIIEKRENKIIIKIEDYINYLDENLLSKLLISNSNNSIDDTYLYIIKLFNENKAVIKDIIPNKIITITLLVNKNELSIDNKHNTIEINLLYNKEKSLYNGLKNKSKDNTYRNIINNKNKLDKENIIKFDLAYDSFNTCASDNTFSAFKSINDIFYLVYGNKKKSIIFYNLIDLKKINEIKNAHNKYITNFRHFLDKKNKRDLIVSISANDNNVKVWNINDFTCLIDIKNINKDGYLNSACFLNDNNNIYIITSNLYYYSFEFIKVFDLNGNKIKDINDSNEKTYFIDSYYDNNYLKNYIITGNIGYIKSYDYNENKVYMKYYEKENKRLHYSIIINNNDIIIKLIESCTDGIIRVWNFHSGELLNKIKVNNRGLNSICMSDNEYLLVGSEDKKIEVIDLKNLLIKKPVEVNQKITTIKIINHPKYDKCLITQGYENNHIKMWSINIDNL